MTRSSDSSRLLRRILGACGLSAITTATLAGCGGNVVLSSGDGGSGGGTATGGAAGSTSTTTTTTSWTTGNGTCTMPVSVTDVDLPTTGPCSTYYYAQYICFPAPNPGAACEGTYSKECVLAPYYCGLQQGGDEACGPEVVNGQCCYTVVGDCPVGRPFTVHGQARLGEAVSRADWADSLSPETATLDPVTRAALADFWSREALAEHASIASFARFSMQLLAAGAPPSLVRGAQRAMADEIDHATIGFGLAAAYSGHDVGPSALDLSGGLDGCMDRVQIAASLAAEGCVAETVSALQVAAARDAAQDPAVKQALATIAEQENEHAELAWKALRWMLETGSPAVRAAVARVFERAEEHVGIGPVPAILGATPCDLEAMRAHGYLPPDERRALAAEVLARVVAPAGRALLAATCAPRSQTVTLQG